MFNEDFMLFLIVLAFIFGLSFLVFKQNGRNKVNRAFVFFVFSIAIWVISNYMQDEVSGNETKFLLVRLDFASAVLMAYFFFIFCVDFSEKYIKVKRMNLYKFILFIVSAFFIMVTLFSKKIVAGVDFLPNVVNPIYGNFYVAYLTFLAFVVFLGVLFLLLKYKKESVLEKKKTRLVFTGIVLVIISMVITNIILPIFIKNANDFIFYSRLGIYSVLILIGFMSYSIVKYKFLNVNLLTAELFSVAILIIFFIRIFSSENIQEVYLKIILFLIVVYFSYMLVRSVKLEVRREKEFRLLAKKLAKANKRLIQLDKSKSEFISITSHQLRTPLSAIKGFVSLLMEGTYGEISEKVKEVLEKISISNERLIVLVNDFLNLSRIEAGKMQYNFDYWQIEDIVQEIKDSLLLRAEEKGLYLKISFPSRLLPKIKIDGAKIKEVISNLVENAVKYTNRGGIKVSFEQEDNLIRVIVSDTGVGISSDEMAQLFSKFSRGENANRIDANGAGLGLYVGKKIIEAHRGRIWAESKGKDKGSRFIVELPLIFSKLEEKKKRQKVQGQKIKKFVEGI